MLNENIKALRRARGLSQEELAQKLSVVRQTVSKWEKGLSVPDAGMLIQLASALDVPVGALLGDAPDPEPEQDGLRAVAAKLELLNEQFARQNERRRRLWRGLAIALAVLAILRACWPLSIPFAQMPRSRQVKPSSAAQIPRLRSMSPVSFHKATRGCARPSPRSLPPSACTARAADKEAP